MTQTIEEIKQYQKQYRESHKEEKKQYQKQYYETHKEEKNQYLKQYYETHKEEKKQYQKQYNEAHKDKNTERIRINQYRTFHPLKNQKTISKCRGLGFSPLNSLFHGFHVHHLHLEGSAEFAVFLPYWEHGFNRHCVKTWKGMDTINAISLDFWINEYLYIDLLEIKPSPVNENDQIEEKEIIPEYALPWGIFAEKMKNDEIESM